MMISHSQIGTLEGWFGGDYQLAFEADEYLPEAQRLIKALKPTHDYEFQLIEDITAILGTTSHSIYNRFAVIKDMLNAYIDKHIDALRAETASAMSVTPPSPRRSVPNPRTHKVVLVMKVSAESVEFAINKFIREHDSAELKAMCDTRDGVLLAFKVIENKKDVTGDKPASPSDDIPS